MKSLVVKRSVVIAGHKTSVSLEGTFWKSLREIGIGRNMGLSAMVAAIDSERQYGNLSSSIRLFVLNFYRNQIDSGSGASRQCLPQEDKGPRAIIGPHEDL
jgi:predicted DNA-binding ribbon-helix-helix protein